MNPLHILQMAWMAWTRPEQRIAIAEIPPGRVIDIGGGGEGVIARVGGAGVVAVDKYLSEIHEARERAPQGTWVVADAASLPFPDRSFDNATAFFSCMYMPDGVKQQALRETRRVLREGGELWIWDAPIDPRGKAFAIRLRIDWPGHTVRTAYGVRPKEQSVESLTRMLGEAGFEAAVAARHERWFWIKARAARGG